MTRAGPYAALTRRDFDDVVGFVEDGGYALAAYDRFRRLFSDAEVEVRTALRTGSDQEVRELLRRALSHKPTGRPDHAGPGRPMSQIGG